MRMIPYDPAAYQLLHDGAVALAQVEANGIRVDMVCLERTIRRTRRKIAHKKAALAKNEVCKVWRKRFRGKTNYGSNQQLGIILFDVMGFDPPDQTKTGRHKTDAASLAKIDHPFVANYLEIAKLEKACNTFLLGILKHCVDGFIHPSFNLHIAKTFRSSSDSPNFQNFPIRDEMLAELVRRVFCARLGWRLLEIDFSGIEVGVAACYHLDPAMLSYIGDETKDMHRDMAMACFMLTPKDMDWTTKLEKERYKRVRYCGKNMFVFPQFYGSYWLDCAESLWNAMDTMKLKTTSGLSLREHMRRKGITELGDQDRSQGKARAGTFEAHIQKVENRFWDKSFPVYAQWKKDWFKAYKKKGWFKTKTGFICQGHMKKNEVINYPVQGSAFHLLLWAFIQIQRKFNKRGMKSKVVGQIHDSLVIDVHPDETDAVLHICLAVMTVLIRKHWPWIIVPLEVEAEMTPVSGSWIDKKVVSLND